MTSFGLDPVLIRTVISDYFISPLSPSSLDTFVSPLDTFVLLSGPMSLPLFVPLAHRTVCPTSVFLVSDIPSVPNLNNQHNEHIFRIATEDPKTGWLRWMLVTMVGAMASLFRIPLQSMSLRRDVGCSRIRNTAMACHQRGTIDRYAIHESCFLLFLFSSTALLILRIVSSIHQGITVL